MTRAERVVGSLLGLACGDALGRPVAGLSGAEIARGYGRVSEMRSAGAAPAGATTEATALARRVGRALRDGTGPVDPPDDETLGLPAAVPYGLVAAEETARADAVERSGLLAGTEATEAAVALTRVLAGLCDGADRTAALDAALSLAVDRDAPGRVRTALAVAADGTTASVEGGGAVGLLEAALHDALTAADPEAATVAAVNRGGRAATAGATTGALAGARFGHAALPDRWRDHLASDLVAECRDLAAALDEAGPGAVGSF